MSWFVAPGKSKKPRPSGTPTPSGTQDTPWLPFNLPTRETLAAQTKKVFAHYFTPFPVSVDNDPAGATEYWQQYWLPPGANEGGTDHVPYGGYVRDRKVFRAPRSGSWQILDKVDEVNQAIASGLDGFLVDILQLSPAQRWNQFIELLDAANLVNDPYFRLVLMPDGDVGATANDLADNLATVAAETKVYHHNDGGTQKLMIAPFNPESAPSAPTFWADVKNRLSGTHGIASLLWPCYVASWTAAPQAPAFDSISYGHSRWGDRDPTATSSSSTSNRGAPAHCHTTYNKPWMHFASPQDMRPSTGHGRKYWEAGGSDNLRESWSAAIDGDADWVQIPTWDDFSENTQICPTRDSGYGWLDLSSYYLTWFKMRAAPTIRRDCVYLIHRPQPFDTVGDVTITGAQTLFMTLNGGTAGRDEIEALAFLTAPADIEIRVNGTLVGTTQSCPAGVTAVKRAMTSGTVSAHIVRGGNTIDSVTSPVPISTTQVSEDLGYRCISSLRS